MDKESPLALTEQHLPALERAIRAEGYEITVNPWSGDVKLTLTETHMFREWSERSRDDDEEASHEPK